LLENALIMSQTK